MHFSLQIPTEFLALFFFFSSPKPVIRCSCCTPTLFKNNKKIKLIVRKPTSPCYNWPIVTFCAFFFLGLHLKHMVVPRLEVESELQLLAYTRATATSDLSRISDLYHSSRQHQILNPLSEARDRTSNLMVHSRICFCCATMGTLDCHFQY